MRTVEMMLALGLVALMVWLANKRSEPSTYPIPAIIESAHPPAKSWCESDEMRLELRDGVWERVR